MTARGLLSRLRGEAVLMKQQEYSAELIEAVTRESNQHYDPGARASEPEIIWLLYDVLITPRLRRRYSKQAQTDPSPYIHLPALAQAMREDKELPEEVIRSTLVAVNDGTLPDHVIDRIIADTKNPPASPLRGIPT